MTEKQAERLLTLLSGFDKALAEIDRTLFLGLFSLNVLLLAVIFLLVWTG